MRVLHVLVKLLIFLSAIIMIVGGHAGAPLLFLEVFLFIAPFDPEGLESGLGSGLLFIAILSALIGHILLLVSIKMRKLFTKIILIIAGEVLVLAAIVILCLDFRGHAEAMVSLRWSIPALVTFVILNLYLAFGKKYWLPEHDEIPDTP